VGSRSVVLVACLVVLGACTMRPSSVWIRYGSTRDHLRFAFGESRGSQRPLDNLESVRVTACGVGKGEQRVGERVLWLATASVPLRDAAGTFEYGQPPRGMTTRTGPEPLTVGCYVVSIMGSGISAGDCFDLRPNGTAVRSVTRVLDCEVRDRAF
jgi:hypothetical protein